MLTPEKLKPLGKHKNICIPTHIDKIYVRGLIKTYYNQLVDGLVIPTIQACTWIVIASLCVIVLWIVIIRVIPFTSWCVLFILTLAILVSLVCGVYYNTANKRMCHILHSIEQHGEESLECFGLVIKRHYKTDRGRCVLEIPDGDKFIKIEVEDFVFDSCVSGSKLLLFYCSDKLLFCAPLQFFEYFMQGSEPLTRKITYSDVCEYYTITLSQWIAQVKETLQEEGKHYAKCLDDLKKKK